jgi:catechol 2,3-dioxygenase-like lactoylglutathione lyase family enzyme
MNVIKPHVSLNVTDIDASVAFYEKAFGLSPSKRRPGYAKFDLTSPLLNLTMQQTPRTGVNASHFGIQVERTDDVLEANAASRASASRRSPRTTFRAATPCRTRSGSRTRMAMPGRCSWSRVTRT